MGSIEENSIKCPYCAETIQKDALKCRYCGEWLDSPKKQQYIAEHSPLKKYYLIWLASILVFIGNFLLSVNGFISDELTILVIGATVILGSFYFVKLFLAILKKPYAESRGKYILISIVTLVLFLGLFAVDFPVFRYTRDVSGLTRAADDMNKLVDSGESGIKKYYRYYLHPKDKNMSEDEFVNNVLEEQKKAPYRSVQRYDIKVDGNRGYIDRANFSCNDKECTDVVDKIRAFKIFKYENNRWYATKDNLLCPREKPYEMSPEFSRALNLMVQRFSQNVDPELSNLYKEILNCVDVKYSQDDIELGGAEGVFSFIPGQSAERLEITVSPRYKIQDDLTTAILLMHEYTHALNYATNLATYSHLDCYEDEAGAFNNENWLMTHLNQGEIQSIVGRLNGSATPELIGVAQTWNAIRSFPGNDYMEKALNYVKANPYYQRQCSTR